MQNETRWLADLGGEPSDMIENLAAVLMEEPELFRSARLLNECRTFVRDARREYRERRRERMTIA